MLLPACTSGATSQAANSSAQALYGESVPPPASQDNADKESLKCLYYDRELFLDGLANQCDYQSQGRLVSAVIPHHLVASDMLSGFFEMASQFTYNTVVIIAPSHYPEHCKSDVVTSKQSWSTPFGAVETDTILVNRLLADEKIMAENNPYAIEYDHGGAGLLPYIAYYLPNTQVVVCHVSINASEERVQAMRQILFEYSNEQDVLLLSSVDFSHYQQPDDAEKLDINTARAIEAFDYETISGFSSDNVDSPHSLMTFLLTIKHYNAEMVQLDHSSSQKKIPAGLSNPIFNEGITTYFIYGGFLKE